MARPIEVEDNIGSSYRRGHTFVMQDDGTTGICGCGAIAKVTLDRKAWCAWVDEVLEGPACCPDEDVETKPS